MTEATDAAKTTKLENFWFGSRTNEAGGFPRHLKAQHHHSRDRDVFGWHVISKSGSPKRGVFSEANSLTQTRRSANFRGHLFGQALMGAITPIQICGGAVLQVQSRAFSGSTCPRYWSCSQTGHFSPPFRGSLYGRRQKNVVSGVHRDTYRVMLAIRVHRTSRVTLRLSCSFRCLDRLPGSPRCWYCRIYDAMGFALLRDSTMVQSSVRINRPYCESSSKDAGIETWTFGLLAFKMRL